VLRLSQRTKLTIEEFQVILDEQAYVNLGRAGMLQTDLILFYDGRQKKYIVGCVRGDASITVMPQQFVVPAIIRRQMTDENFYRAKNLFYDVAVPKFLMPCPSTLDVYVAIRTGKKYMVHKSFICRIDRCGYETVSSSEVFLAFTSEILQLFRTENEKGVLAYDTVIEVLLYDQDDCLVTCFQTNVRRFFNQYVKCDTDLTADLRVSYLSDVTVLPLGVVPYAVVRDKKRVWYHFADSLERVVEACEMVIPHHILAHVRYRLQFSYQGFTLSDWQSLHSHSTVCRILDYHPR
jgi:hypothetical protein